MNTPQSNAIHKKAIFFDRDGTLIKDQVYLNDPDKIEFLPDTFAALRLLQTAGFLLFIVTNQSGVARGLVSMDNLIEIHGRMNAFFAKENIHIVQYYYAPYGPQSNHPLRKPNPGMLLTAQADYQIDLTQSWMIGDQPTDIEAGHRARTKTGWLSPSTQHPQNSEKISADVVAQNLLTLAQRILQF